MPANGASPRRDLPQGLKPVSFYAVYGTTGVVPFQSIIDQLCGGHTSNFRVGGYSGVDGPRRLRHRAVCITSPQLQRHQQIRRRRLSCLPRRALSIWLADPAEARIKFLFEPLVSCALESVCRRHRQPLAVFNRPAPEKESAQRRTL